MWYNTLMQAISLANVSYRYPVDDTELVAVDHVDLRIDEGEFVVLLGTNGSGKSTLAKMMNGLLVPQEGAVSVYGDSTADERDEVIFRIRSTVGMVFQNPDNQMVASIIEDDVAFGPENLGVPRDEMIERVKWALESVGMYAYRQHTPLKLSGGQKQRVAIASVLAMKPKVLVLDESTAMLDPVGRAEVMQVLRDLNRREGLTVVLITHHMDEALEADRVVVMDSGAIAMDGTPREIFAQVERLHSLGLAAPDTAELLHLLRSAGAELPQGALTAAECADAIANWLGK